MKFRELSKKWKAVVILLSALLVVLMLFVSTERSKWSKARKRITRQSVIPVAWRWSVSEVVVCSQRWQPAYHTGRIRGFSGSLLREKPLESESSYWSAPGCQQAYNGVSRVLADITGSLPIMITPYADFFSVRWLLRLRYIWKMSQMRWPHEVRRF